MIELPWPPSLNHYWRSVRGHVLISEEGRLYRKMIAQLALMHRFPKFGTDRIRITIHAEPPDKRRRDLDNLLKAVFDALQHAGVYADDGQIDEINISRMKALAPGRLFVTLERPAK